MFESLGSGLLAILLLVAGIMFLRGRPTGIKLHRIWAWIKLPLAIGGAIWFGLTIREWQFASAANPSSVGAASLLAGVGLGLLSLAWPVIVLVVMRARSVREHFANVL